MGRLPQQEQGEISAEEDVGSDSSGEALVQGFVQPRSAAWRASAHSKIGPVLLGFGTLLVIVSVVQLHPAGPPAEVPQAPQKDVEHREAGKPLFLQDVEVDFNCNDGYSQWREGWSLKKKLWCCHNFGRGCELHNFALFICLGILGFLMVFAGIAFLVAVMWKKSKAGRKDLMKWAKQPREEDRGCLGCCTK